MKSTNSKSEKARKEKKDPTRTHQLRSENARKEARDSRGRFTKRPDNTPSHKRNSNDSIENIIIIESESWDC